MRFASTSLGGRSFRAGSTNGPGSTTQVPLVPLVPLVPTVSVTVSTTGPPGFPGPTGSTGSTGPTGPAPVRVRSASAGTAAGA